MTHDADGRDDQSIFDLTEVFDDIQAHHDPVSESLEDSRMITIDGQAYETLQKSRAEDVHELQDVVEEGEASDDLQQVVLKRVTEITRKIAREMLPDIAERIIREEIEKIKRGEAGESKG